MIYTVFFREAKEIISADNFINEQPTAQNLIPPPCNTRAVVLPVPHGVAREKCFCFHHSIFVLPWTSRYPFCHDTSSNRR
jgi:hypothetical protein